MLKTTVKSLKMGYIKLPSFYLDFDAAQRFDPNTRSSFRDMMTILQNLKKEKVDAIVIDLRGNPGGALDEAINIAGLFIDSGPLLQIKGIDRWGNRNSVKVLDDNYPGVFYSGPLTILVDKFSASASEILAGAITGLQPRNNNWSHQHFRKGFRPELPAA